MQPLRNDELVGYSQKRREGKLRVFAVFISLSAAAIMIFVVGRLIHKRITSDRLSRASAESERQEFESRLSSVRNYGDEAGARGKFIPREITPNTDVVDMTTRSSSVRNEPLALRTPAIESTGATPRPPDAGGPCGIEHIEQKQTAIAEVLREFFEARAIAEMLPLVRDGRRVRPLMEEYYQRNPVKDRTWKSVGWAIPVEESGYRFAYVQATFTDASPVNVVIEETESGFFVDWESSVQYSEIGWKEFMATRPGQPKMFRVIASKAEAGEGAGQAALTLKHPQESGVVLGRFDLNDPRFRPLVDQLDSCKWKDVPVIVRLCYPGPTDKGAGSEVQIAGVEGKGWLILGDRTRGS